MLRLRLKSGEYLAIGENIAVQVFQKKNNYLEVAVKAPRDVLVLRGEVYEQTNARPDFLREHRTQTPSERAANMRRKETLARRADATQELNSIFDRLERQNPELTRDITSMREQVSRLNGEIKA